MPASPTAVSTEQSQPSALPTNLDFTDPQFHGATHLPTGADPGTGSSTPHRIAATNFSAHSYLRYQKEKFIRRFDANCYIAITRKLDTHDLSVHCPSSHPLYTTDPLRGALSLITQPTLVLGIQSDGLFTFAEQRCIAEGIPGARLEEIESPEGHDAFLLQFKQVNGFLVEFLRACLPDLYAGGAVTGLDGAASDTGTGGEGEGGYEAKKSSTFGEVEVGDITAW